MKSWIFVAGMAAGALMATSAVASMYPDVPRRMLRDSKRTMMHAKRFSKRLMG
ncbi:MAG: hypothetical protein Q4B99_03135 [Clostridia bacterium]|nr:hypothetical protein [Clostridia bacterium]